MKENDPCYGLTPFRRGAFLGWVRVFEIFWRACDRYDGISAVLGGVNK
jgi:hypothetical protein